MFEGFATVRIEANGVGLHVVHGGSGPAVLLLHGYPQTHAMWHKVAPELARTHTIVAPDMRGYGDSDKPKAAPGDHEVYCKRTTANDLVAMMDTLGHRRWHVAGHDRGARVAHRMALDHPERIASFTSLDVVSSQAAFEGMDASLAFAWFHWNLMRQPHPLPETLIGNSVKAYFDFLMERWCATPGAIDPGGSRRLRTLLLQPGGGRFNVRRVPLDRARSAARRRRSRPQARLPDARAVGHGHHQATRMADRREARHARYLARTRSKACAGTDSTAATSCPRNGPARWSAAMLDFYSEIEGAP